MTHLEHAGHEDTCCDGCHSNTLEARQFLDEPLQATAVPQSHCFEGTEAIL